LAYNNIKGQAVQLQAQLEAHLQAGQNELEAAKTSLKLANNSHDPALVSQAKVHFIVAKLRFTAAQQIADSSQLLQRVEGLPMVGDLAQTRHLAVDGIAQMGISISDAGVELANLDEQVIKPPGANEQARTLLTTLDQTHKGLVKVRADFVRAQKAAAEVDVRLLPPAQQGAFLKGRETLTSALSAIDEFARLVPVLTEMLGGNGVRRFLIEQVNPAELRAGGGFIGTYSVLQAEQGTLKLIKSGSSYDFAPPPRPMIGQRGYVTPPGPLRDFLLVNTSWSFMDSNVYPDFPSNAQVAKQFVESRLGMSIDGVIAMDYYTVVALLTVTGPITVPSFHITVDASNFLTEVIQRDLVLGDLTHKALTSALAGPLMERVAALPSNRWPFLVTALNDMASGRHLQAYSTNPAVEKELDRIGWSGTLNPAGSQDWMMYVESNLAASKANYFVARHYTVELTRSGPNLNHRVTVDITNNANWDLHPNEYYRAYLSLYTTDTASQPSSTVRAPWNGTIPPPAGTRMTAGWAPFMPGYGSTTHNSFEYSTPWHADGRGTDRVYWQKQPGADARNPDQIDVIWHDGSGHTYTAKGDLAQDRMIMFSSRGVSILPVQKAQATLPSLSLG
jgi:hypothetical protein